MIRRCRPLLGTYVEITSEDIATIDRGFEAVARVHALMSAHDAHSEIGRLNREGHWKPVHLHEWTCEVLLRSLDWSRRSHGAFDVVRSADTDWRVVRIDGDLATLAAPARIDLGGIAKGFAVDRAVDAMVLAGARHGFVNAGGDCRAFGDPIWPVIVVEPTTRAPFAEIQLCNNALATSAVHPDGRTNQLDRSDLLSVTVRADTACDADALTKVMWSGTSLAAGLLADCGATAFAIRADGKFAKAA